MSELRGPPGTPGPAPKACLPGRRVHPSRAFVEFLPEAIEQSIPARFEQQVRQYPDRIAVVTRRDRLTYEALDRAANRVAHAILARRGPGPEPVALLFEQGAAVIAAILGVLKAGKLYVPLDPSYPAARNAFMLADCQAPLLLTNSRHHPLAEAVSPGDCQVLNTDDPEAGGFAASPDLVIPPNALAYILYTSGSTGEPKGVMASHRNVLQIAREHTNSLCINPTDRHTLLHSCSFSAAVRSIFETLLNGATLCPLDVQQEGVGGLAQWLIQEEITIYRSVVSTFRQFLDALTGQEQFPHLRLVYLGGEALYRRDVELFRHHFPPECLLATQYALGETGPVTRLFIDSKTPMTQNHLPVGYPVDDTEVLLLDEDGQATGANATGEIAVRSGHLCPGYWRRPDLTHSAFRPDPRGNGEIIYRTGDLGRLLPDGCLIHLGRRDSRVKVRGYRVELAETESAVCSLAAVKEAVVVAREDEPGVMRVVAYLVPARSPAPSASVLRRALAETLPEFMIPDRFVLLEALPLTATGKVDRQALPPPGDARPALDSPFVLPRTPLEVVLAGIWQQVLGLQRVGIHDSFFELGGHSLLGAQVVARMQQLFPAELSLRRLFEAPTVAELADALVQRERAPGQMSALAELHQAGRGPGVAPWDQITPRQRNSDPPLSFEQQRLWFLEQLLPGTPRYNIARALRLQGVLQVEALQQALDTLVARHEVLRTTFRSVDGTPRQVIAERCSVAMPTIDLRDQPEDVREQEARLLLHEEMAQPFDLARDLMVRAALLRLAAEEHVLLLVLHHVAIDVWSMGVLFRELGSLYAAFTEGKPSPLPPLPVQYADYAVWQRRGAREAAFQAQLAYWRQQLENAPTLLQLPTDRPRPTVRTYPGARHVFSLSPALIQALTGLSRQDGVTLFMTLLAAFQTLLHRYDGEEDILVGSPIADRGQVETEGLIGFFLNTLVLRTDMSGDPSFRALLGRVREVCLGAYAHQDLPFEKLVEELQPKRSSSHSPFFQVMFSLENESRQPPRLTGLTVDEVPVESGTARFDLTLALVQTARGLTGTLEYDTDLFDAATIARMAGHFQTLLAGIASDPGQRLSRLPLLTAPERHQLLVEWNATYTDYPRDACIHELFEAQAARTPDATAVVYQEERLTYRELNERANRLAHHLQASGVRPGALVGLCVHRSPHMMVGLLGILKAGGAYLPLEPGDPPQRTAAVLTDARVRALVTEQHCVPPSAAPAVHVVRLDADAAAIALHSGENPDSEAKSHDLSYVIYTSGSTGKPKGVMIEHQSVVSLWAALCRSVYDSVADAHLRISLNASLSFDASVQQWVMLLSGHTLDIIPGEIRRDAEAFLAYLRQHRLDVLDCVPSQLKLLLAAGLLDGSEWVPSVVLAGGEAIDLATWQTLRQAEGTQFYNMYGPTECTVDSTIGCVRRASSQPTIGRPLANVQIYILDAQLQPVPIGVPGELYIGGSGVARGYLNRPELTGERFIVHPFSEDPAARLYKTGDRARYLPDGQIEFLGRLDYQVKLRGYRIELGEIEAVLSRHPAVWECVVLLREYRPDDQRLVAYVAPGHGGAATAGDLRSFLREKLPEYMVPAAIVMLESLPLTPGGKIDRAALPEPHSRQLGPTDPSPAPLTLLEERLAAILAEVLGLERVGAQDDFFRLGGHSLSATRVISRIRQELEVELPLRCLFDTPTVAGLAAAIVERLTDHKSLGSAASGTPMPGCGSS